MRLCTETPADALPRLAAAPRRLRVCHVVSADLWAGAEVQVATAASYLAGHPGVELTAVLLNEGSLARELRRLGVPVTVMDERRHNALSLLISLTRWLRSHPVEIVHTHRYKETVLGALAAKLAGVPALIRTVHGQSEPMRGWPRAKLRTYEALDRWTLRCFADRIIAVSRRMADSLRESGYARGTVVPIHNGVDLRKVRPARPRSHVRRELGVDPAAPLFGTVGRLVPVKGHAHFLRAARLILQSEPGARFLIVGDGPLSSELAVSARHLGIDHACAFVGARTDVYDLVAAMDGFVLPSLDEGIPMALLEAMALGVPVVAAAVGGIPEVVAHRATGLLVDARDEAAVAEACLELTRDRDSARTRAARARRAVERDFSHEQNGRALVNAYCAVIPGPDAEDAHGQGAPPRRPLLRLVPGSGGKRALSVEQARGLLARGARRLRAAVVRRLARRRADRFRRDPRRLVAALRSAEGILVVCHGNIIRSPFAARLLAQALGQGRVAISSGGLAATPGTPSPREAVLASARHHVDLDGHVASAVTGRAVAVSDVIFVMDVPQLRELRRRFPEARGKAFLLTCLAPASPPEIRDPFGGDDSMVQACFEHICAAVRPIAGVLTERVRAQ